MKELWQDVRYAVRTLAKQPGFVLVALLTLALGIGANTAIFSVVKAVLLEPLPYRDADRLVMVWESRRGAKARATNVISMGNFMDWREKNTSFEDMAAFYDSRLNLTGVEDPEEIPAQTAMPEFFPLIGAEPLFGRTFNAQDVKEGAEDVVMISHGLWQRRFGSDPNVLGKKILLNGRPQTIIAVMPPGFHFLIQEWSLTKQKADIWIPWQLTENNRIRRGRFASAVAKLKPGVPLGQAQAEMSGLAASFEKQYPDFNTNWGVNLVPLRRQISGEIRTPLLILLGAVGFVLLIGCANVANLLLARSATRRRELAIRTALGAGRGRVVRQLLTESVILSVIGGAFAVLLAIWGLDALLSLSPAGLLPAEGVRLDLPVLGFTLALSLLTGLLFGLAPAIQATRLSLTDSLKEGGRGAGAGLHTSRSRSVLVMGEVALALVLLIGAGLLVRSLVLLRGVAPGFDGDKVLSARIVLPGSKYREGHQRVTFFQDLITRLESLPEVRSAGAVNFLPFAGIGAATSIVIDGRPAPAVGEEPSADSRVAHPNYFRTMGIPLLRGRNFTELEAREMKHVVLINQTMAKEYWPNEDPIGKRVTINMKDENVPSEIIGVVGDVHHMGLHIPVRPMAYSPHPELAYSFMTVVLRTDGDPRRLAPLVQQAVRAMDPDQPVANVLPVSELVRGSLARQRFSTVLLGLFAGLAMLLAAIGIYGVMAYSVSQRTREMGIRMALGAQSGNVLGLVIRQGMALVVVGVAAGIGAALWLTRFMESELFGIQPLDFFTFAAVPLLLAAAALLACTIPAWRATRVDPMEALRYE